MKDRINYIIEYYGMEPKQDLNGNYLQQGAPRIENLKELVVLIYSDRNKWKELFKYCESLDYCLFHNEACEALMEKMLKELECTKS